MTELDPKANTTIAFTDGACKGNPGAGGWGAYLIFSDGSTQAWCGGDTATTNNRMELMGAIAALQHSPAQDALEIWTDSNYVKNGITLWIDGWKNKGWKTASKKPVANQDLWQQLDHLRQSRSVSWHWVKGHAGHAGNEKADELANLGVDRGLSDEPDPCLVASTSTPTHRSASSSPTNSANTLKKNTDLPSQLTDTSDQDNAESAPSLNSGQEQDDDWLLRDPLGLDLSDEISSVPPNLDLSEPPLTNLTQQYSDDMNPDCSTSSDLTNASNISSPASSTTKEDLTQGMTPTNEQAKPSFDGDTSRANPHFVPLLPEPIHKNANARQLIMDTETTGLDALKGDRIIEVGIVELVGRKFTGEKLHVYINPERSMDAEAIRIHGISEAFLQDKPKFADVARPLFDFMAGAEVIAHNAPFDIGFLTVEFDKVGLEGFADTITITDSLVMAKQQYPGQKNTLDALVKRLNVGKQDRTFHGALLDAEILAEVYLAMTGGQVALAIDDDDQIEGGGSHAQFAHLAKKLIASPTDKRSHQDWLENLRSEYPALNSVWQLD